MGMVNRVVPHDRLERVAYDWAREIMSKSPTAIKMLKFGFNLIDDGLVDSRCMRVKRRAWRMAPTRRRRARRVPGEASAGFFEVPEVSVSF